MTSGCLIYSVFLKNALLVSVSIFLYCAVCWAFLEHLVLHDVLFGLNVYSSCSFSLYKRFWNYKYLWNLMNLFPRSVVQSKYVLGEFWGSFDYFFHFVCFLRCWMRIWSLLTKFHDATLKYRKKKVKNKKNLNFLAVFCL